MNTSTPEEGFTGLIERVTLGNSAPGNRVGEGRVGDRPRASFVRAAILYENALVDVIGSRENPTSARAREDALSLRGAWCYLFPMSTLAEIEKSVSQFSAEELAELEQIIRKARREKEQAQKPSLRDTDPVSVGTILKPIGTRDEWYSEMLEGRA